MVRVWEKCPLNEETHLLLGRGLRCISCPWLSLLSITDESSWKGSGAPWARVCSWGHIHKMEDETAVDNEGESCLSPEVYLNNLELDSHGTRGGCTQSCLVECHIGHTLIFLLVSTHKHRRRTEISMATPASSDWLALGNKRMCGYTSLKMPWLQKQLFLHNTWYNLI